MTDTNNTRPGKPGVPLNPEKDGWHWLRTPDGEIVPYNWRPEGECERGRWASEWVYDKDDDWPPEECAYLAPCLTPDQASALQTRVAELEGALRIAKISIKTWGAHSSKHYRELWDLAGEIKKIDVALEGKKDER